MGLKPQRAIYHPLELQTSQASSLGKRGDREHDGHYSSATGILCGDGKNLHMETITATLGQSGIHGRVANENLTSVKDTAKPA